MVCQYHDEDFDPAHVWIRLPRHGKDDGLACSIRDGLDSRGRPITHERLWKGALSKLDKQTPSSRISKAERMLRSTCFRSSTTGPPSESGPRWPGEGADPL